MPITPGELERAAKRSGGEPPKIVSDRRCIGCGYQLRGLAMGGRCPECGLPIVSLGTIDDPLSQAPVRMIKRFRLGCWVAMGCLLSQVGIVIARIQWPQFESSWAAVMCVVALLWFGAVVLLTPAFRTPQAISWGFGERGKLRVVARWLQVGWVVAYAAHALEVAGVGSAGAAGVGGLLDVVFKTAVVIGLVGLVVLGIVLGRLSGWARDDTAEKWFNFSIWGVPIGTFFLWMDVPLVLVSIVLFLFWLVAVLAFPLALFSLSRSVMYSVHHSRDWQERMQRKHELDEAYHARMGDRAVKTADPSSVGRGDR